MKKKFLLSIAMLMCICHISNAQCMNGDAEMGNFTNWTAYKLTNNTTGTLNLSTAIPVTPPTSVHLITNTGTFDPIVGGTILPTVITGNHSFQLGDSNVIIGNPRAQALAYTFTVNPSNVHFSFRYAMVLQDPGHQPGDNPFFSYWISTSNSIMTSTLPGNLITEKRFEADASNPFFTVKEGTTDVIYKKWVTECFNLQDYMNQQVTIYFATANCTQTRHYCYAYIDDLCGLNVPRVSLSVTSPVCISNGFTANGSGSIDYTQYSYKLQRLNSSTPNDVVLGTDVQGPTIFGPIPTNYDLKTMYLNAGKTFVSGYYEVILTIKNCVNIPVYKSVVVFVDATTIDGPVVYNCCDDQNRQIWNLSADIHLFPGQAMGTVEWYDADGNYIGHGTNTFNSSTATVHSTITATKNITSYSKFRVRYLSSIFHCPVDQWITAVLMPVLSGTRLSAWCYNGNSCGPRLLKHQLHYFYCDSVGMPQMDNTWDSLIQASVHYLWNTGATTKDIVSSPSISSYTCDISWPCGSTTTAITVNNNPYPGPSSSPGLVHTTGVHSSGGHFRIFPTGANYGFYWYRLRVYNRWGQCIYDISRDVCSYGQLLTDDFDYGDVAWDLIMNQGSLDGKPTPPDNGFNFQLDIKDCVNGQRNAWYYGSFDIL